MVEISVIIPVLNEEKYIVSCLDSVLASDYDKSKIEILIVDGVSSDNTRVLVDEYIKEYDFIKLLANPDKIAPVSMNIGIQEAKGKYVIRLDAHASYPRDYFSKLMHYHQKLDADNIGGIIKTDVKDKTLKSNAIKKVLSHRLGVGNSDFRVGVEGIKSVDTVPFGCYPKEVFQKYGVYDERLVRNQDIELNKRIIRNGGKIYLISDIRCTYYSREHFIDLSKNQYQNGFWNVLTAYYTNTISSLSLRHFIPLFFVLSLLLPLLLSWFTIKFLWIAFFSLVSYLSLVIIVSFRLNNTDTNLLSLVKAFLTLHFSYGLGSFMGIFSVFKKIIKGEK